MEEKGSKAGKDNYWLAGGGGEEETCFRRSPSFNKSIRLDLKGYLPVAAAEYAKPLKEKKILLVEDNRVNQLVTSRLLQKWGYKSRVAQNGQEAIRLAAEQRYDLILMDLQMPKMDGTSAAEVIRALDLYYSRVPILALTAAAGEQLKTVTHKAAFTDIIMKPFKPEELYNNIHKYLCTAEGGANPNPLQEKIEEITQGDESFKKQLVYLYLQSFREILDDLKTGKLLELAYLRHVRHKHKATFKMLGLDALENSMLRLQEQLTKAETSSQQEALEEESLAEINQLGKQVIRQLEAIF